MTVSRRRLLTGPLLGKCRRRAIPEPRMPPLTVIEDLDVLRDLSPSLSQVSFGRVAVNVCARRFSATGR
jgi:hypothetical protein